jgi:hypothetical protein
VECPFVYGLDTVAVEFKDAKKRDFGGKLSITRISLWKPNIAVVGILLASVKRLQLHAIPIRYLISKGKDLFRFLKELYLGQNSNIFRNRVRSFQP